MSTYLHAQKLNRRITIERKTDQKDDYGQTLKVWRRLHACWAEPKTQTGMGYINNEFVAGGTEVSRTAVSWRIRKPSTIAPDAGDRVVYKGQPYDIRAVLPDLADNRYVFLACAVGANEGG